MPDKRIINKSSLRKLNIFICDFILLSAGLALLEQLFLIAGLISLCLSLLRFNERIRQSKPMLIAYWFLTLLTLDQAAMISTMVNYSRGPLFFFFPAAAYCLLLIVRKKKGYFYYLTPSHLLLFPMCLCALMAVRPFSFSDMPCGEIETQPVVRMILNKNDINVPRNVIDRPEFGDALIAYKVEPPDPFTSDPDRKISIRTVNRKTGGINNWLNWGRPLGLAAEPNGGDVYAMLAKGPYDKHEESDFKVRFIRFSSAGEIKNTIDLKVGRGSYYVGNIILRENGAIAILENKWFYYDKSSDKIRELDSKQIARNAPVYFTDVAGDALVGVFASGLGIFSLITGRRNVIKVDLASMNFVKSYKGSFFGYYDVKNIPGTDHFIISRPWLKGGYEIDSDLNIIRNIDLPDGTRNIEVSSDGRLVFAGNYYDGYVYVLDLSNNKIAGRVFAGKNIRGMDYTSDGCLLVGSRCGLAEIDMKKFKMNR